MPRTSYALTAATIVASVGAGVFCLDMGALGQTFRLHAERPGAHLNSRILSPTTRIDGQRADMPEGSAIVGAGGIVESKMPLILVRIDGPLEQRAGYHDPCGGWTDGHDAVAERLTAALAEGDVLLVGDGPGGAAAGIQQAVARVLEAKAAHGRRITGYADERVASAHAWWMLAVCDEIFIPPMGIFGSVGARGEHMDISGAMAMEGLKKTYFADPPDKVALAPEFPLSPVGEMRGNRDVSLGADAFRAAVCASPIGLRYGLTPEGLIALGADMLTGVAAVGIFVDGVEDFPIVVARALQLAESPEAKAIDAAATGAAGAKETGMSLRAAEGDKPDKDPDDDGDEDRGSDVPTKCASCGVENQTAAKFCMGCGESMATKPIEEEPPPPSSKPGKPATAEPPKMQAPAKMDPSASLASILGASGESPLALKTAAIGLRQVRDTAAGVTRETSPGKIVGALLTVPERLEQASLVAADAKRGAAKAATERQWALASRLNKLGLDAWPRTAIFRDEIDPTTNKRRAVALQPTIAKWDADELDGYVSGFEKARRPASPFEANRDRAREDAAARAGAEGVGGNGATLPDGKPTKAQIESAKKDPTVLRMFHAQGNTHTLDAIAERYVINAAQNGVSLGGAP